MPCITNLIRNFNAAFEKTSASSGNCAICHDTLGDSGGGASPELALTVLPGCKHRFHEICLMQWLAPIQLPPTKQAQKVRWTALLSLPTFPAGPVTIARDSGSPTLENFLQEGLRVSIRRFAGCVQQLLNRIENDARAAHAIYDERADEYAQLHRSIQSNRRLVATIVQQSEWMTTNQMLQAWRELETGMDEMLLADEEDDLEEGEIREDDSATPNPFDRTASTNHGSHDSQDLPPLNLFDGSILDLHVSRSSQEAARSSQCPLCRQFTFAKYARCHSDTVQLMRVRLRLTDLAYACFNFDRSAHEEEERDEIQMLLERRYDDNVALGEEELIRRPAECRKIFTQARETLRRAAYMYMQTHTLSAAEQLRIVQLAMFFENFKLKDKYIPYFFDPRPELDDRQFEMDLSVEDIRDLNEDPKRFFEEQDLVTRVEDGITRSAIRVDRDEEMAEVTKDEESEYMED
ncbi:MAG: hypothetical protein LQ338_003235 [Usnochroma carphineum]|nr:MAG: hypothetical protein LQ338_003235 [Usnochroma carphineum]